MAIEVVNDDTERDYTGCYGHKGGHEELDIFLEDFIESSLDDEKNNPDERWAACIWGHPGIGKTSKIKAYRNKPVTWNGQEFDGWDVRDVPVAQFEEMGDIHGLPDKCVFVVKSGHEGRWVSCDAEILEGWKLDGWKVDHEKGARTMYAPPDFVPSKPGPAIIIFDDANRTSQRIMKGLMQVFQTHGTVSWKLPPGCIIILTGNPGMQDFMVTELDEAIISRMVHFTLKHDAKQWVLWATANNLDPRGISFVSRYPEMMVTGQRTNPRALAKFFRYLKGIKDISSNEQVKRVRMFAQGVLDDTTVSSMLIFMQRDVELVIEPEAILDGEDWIPAHMKTLYDGVKNKKTGETERRIDILAVTVDRLFAHMARPDFEQKSEHIKSFQAFATSKYLEEDMRYNLCMRVYRRGNMQKWLLGNAALTSLVMEVV